MCNKENEIPAVLVVGAMVVKVVVSKNTLLLLILVQFDWIKKKHINLGKVFFGHIMPNSENWIKSHLIY